MANIFVDAIVLALSAVNASIETLDEYIQQLLELQEWSEEDSADLLISADAQDALVAAQSYPLCDSIAVAAGSVQRLDVFRIVTSIFNKLRTTEDATGLKDLLFEVSNCVPSDHLSGRHEGLVKHHHRLLAMMALERAANATSSSKSVLFTRGLKAPTSSIMTSGQVTCVDGTDRYNSINFPYDYNEAILCCDSRQGWHQLANPVDLWLKGKYSAALTIAIKKRCNTEMAGGSCFPSGQWRFGPSFADSLGKLGFRHEPSKITMLLRACAEVSLNANMSSVHALRSGDGPTAPQKKRSSDGSKAMRRDIDYEFHLHYWLTATGPEFASVVVHNDFSIPS